ncbi:hypothetical protein DY000_02046593 [Brassica cretica]|uniref:Uncharacterized protein n=1 Tax=Brassica cretica TaxID=69181 RepID=A0ABQ7F4C8_BRACR|nr:hypothetical protein DY000_02046593 [Brassica cretica]
MHPPDLKMLETNSGLRGSDGSFGGKAQATGSNSTLDEDEDDGDYDYNYWHEFVRKDCETDEDDDFDGCPPKGWRGGRSDLNGYERSVARGGRGQGSGKPASGRGQQSRVTGGSSSSKNRSNMRCYVDMTGDQRDFLCTSRIIDVAYTQETDISLGVDVVHATPAKDRNQLNHEENSVYRRLTESTSGTVRCALTFETGTVETVDVVVVTPPQQNKKHNRVIEDDEEFVDPPLTETVKVCNSTRASDETHSGETDDEFVDPPLTETTKVCNSTSASDKTHSGENAVNVLVSPLKQYKNHTDEKETGESDDAVLVTPPKQYNKHNRVIEADYEFVDPPVIQTTEFDGGESFTPGKHFPSTSVFVDDNLFVDPPMLGLPCRHAIAVSSYRNMEYNFFVSQYHVKDTWSEIVKGIIVPVSNPEDIHISADILKLRLFPPVTKRTKGRPCIKRKLSAREVPTGKRGYELVHQPSILKRCNVTPIVDETPFAIEYFGNFRTFFLKCVEVGNVEAIYYEGLHRSTSLGVEEGIKVLEANVPKHGLSTLAVGIFYVCLVEIVVVPSPIIEHIRENLQISRR